MMQQENSLPRFIPLSCDRHITVPESLVTAATLVSVAFRMSDRKALNDALRHLTALLDRL